MERTPAGKSRVEPEVLHDFRLLLRSMGRPGLLRSVTLSESFAGQNHEAITRTLRSLPSRQRAIVERCDFDGEPQGNVAKSLGISRRHLIREHNAAIATMAQSEGKRSAVQLGKVDDVASKLSLSLTLENTGYWRDGADILERLATELIDPGRRSEVILRLARLYTNADRLTLAKQKVEAAQQLAAITSDSSGWQRAEADVASARVAEAAGDSNLAETIAGRATRILRSSSIATQDPRVAAALLDGLVLQGEIALGRGDVRRGAELAATILPVLDTFSYDPQLVIAARVITAMTDVLRSGPGTSGEIELWKCYTFALERGLTKQATLVAAHIGAVLRLRGRAGESLDLLKTMLPIARTVGTSSSLGGLLVELASYSVNAGDIELSERYIGELISCSQSNPYVQAYGTLLAAKCHLAKNDLHNSLRCAEAAESAFVRIGKERYLGLSLQIQALALAGLDQKQAAVRTMQLAIDRQRALNHPFRLAEAYRAMAAITGARRFELAARNAELGSVRR
jgi:hypothetical protein